MEPLSDSAPTDSLLHQGSTVFVIYYVKKINNKLMTQI